MKPFLALMLCLCLSAAHQSLAQPYPFPTESKKLGSAGTPGDLDREFQSFLGGPFSVRFLDNPPDIRTAMVQTDGKILIGGTFRLQASNITYALPGATESFTVTVVWRNLARLNADGTLDTDFISPQALNVAKATGRGSVVYGPDGAVYSILVESNDDLYQYLIAGDFLNFSHNELGNPAPRKRYLTLRTLDPNPNLTPIPAPGTITVANSLERINLRDPNNPTRPARVGTIVFQQDNGVTYRKIAAGFGGFTQPGMPGMDNWQAIPPPPLPSEPLVSLTLNVAEGEGFNGPVRKLRRLTGSIVQPQFTVTDTNDRLDGPFDNGDIVLQLDNQFIYQKISGPRRNSANDDWLNLPGGRQILYFATGDFTRFVNDSDARRLTRFILSPGGITLPPATLWTPPKPNARVWDVTAINDRIYFVGEFTSVVDVGSSTGSGVVGLSRIACIDESGKLDTRFNPGIGSDGNIPGFNDTAFSIVADPEGYADYPEPNLIVAGEFTSYQGTLSAEAEPDQFVGRIARIAQNGDPITDFPAPNYGNSFAANGPIRCVTRQPDGRLFIAGSFTTYNGIPRPGIARLEADGSLDLTFSPPGVASGIMNIAFDIDGGPGTASTFARPVAVGNFSRLFGSPFTGVARFIGGSLPVIWYQPAQIPPIGTSPDDSSPFSVLLGSDITLSVVASDNFTGFPGANPPFLPPQAPAEPLEYQWQKNGQNILGENLPYLPLNRISRSALASYRVWIYNSKFGVLSDPVALSLRNPFVDILPPQGLRVEGLIGSNSILAELGGTISLQITNTGLTTGTIRLANPNSPPTVLRVRGQYNFDTGLAIEIPVPNRSPLLLNLSTILFRGQTVFEFDGEISDTSGNSAPITASNVPWSKANPATEFAGKYSAALQANAADLGQMVGGFGPAEIPLLPQGFGLLTMQVNPVNGQARIAGSLSDGTKFTAASFIRADQASSIPLWISLYQGQGALAGQLDIQPNGGSNPLSANLRWSRPNGQPLMAPNEGFLNVSLTATPSSGKFDPATLATIPAFTLSLSDELWAGLYGAMAFPIEQPFLVSGTRITPELPNPNKVTLKVNTGSGLAAGSFEERDPTGALRKVKFQAIMTTSDGAPQFNGFFIMPNLVRNPDYYIGGSVTGF